MQNVIITYQTGQIVVASFPGTEEGEEEEHMVYTVHACACAKAIWWNYGCVQTPIVKLDYVPTPFLQQSCSIDLSIESRIWDYEAFWCMRHAICNWSLI